MYADYAYYTEIYLGAEIKAPDFPRLERRAGEFINYLTQNRAKQAEDDTLTAVKDASCALAEKLQAQDLAAGGLSGPIASEKVGGQSVSYAVAQAGTLEYTQAQQAELVGIARRYLAHTGLLYGGVPIC